MKSEWAICTLGEICVKIGSGATPRGGEESYKKSGISLIRSQNVLDFSFSSTGLALIDDIQAKQLNNVTVQKNDVLINITGDSIARTCIVPNEYLPARVNQHVCIVRADHQKVLPNYILYYLQLIKPELLSIGSSGGTRNALTKEMLEQLKIFLPPLPIQHTIADALSALDEKIENNTKINHHLEQMAQAIFKSWFVDFEPWGGVMPDDWRERRLGEFFPVITGKMNANVSSTTGLYPFFSCSQTIAWTDQYSFNGKAILVAGNGDFNVKWYDGKFEAYQRTYVLIPYDSRLLAFLYYATQDGLSRITSTARGSVIRFITKGSIENHSIFVPDNLTDLPVVAMLQNINTEIAHNTYESARLAELRDTLLPRLMSGELSVADLDDAKND